MTDTAEDVPAELRRWVDAELAPWQNYRPGPDGLDGDVRTNVDEDPSVFRISISNGIVTFHEKPPEQYLAQLGSAEVYRPLRDRGLVYERFLQSVVDAFGVTGSAVLAIDLDDLVDRTFVGPMFRFQKVRGTSQILLPDVDMFHWDFYLSSLSEDPVPFADKIDNAIFVGSTSGMQLPITRATVEELAHPRLRSAMYFKGHPDVRFELPSIVQCDGPETVEMIRALGLGSINRSWGEQFTHRYLISIDGNGATCSRVAVSLKSNSILMRYHSINGLYYFHGLQPWKHYVPVESDAEVAENIAALRSDPDRARSIAEESRVFYRAYLSRISVMRYTADLLQRYIAMLGTPAPESAAAAASRPVFAIDSFGHVTNQGDIWSRPNGWLAGKNGNWIEGIALVPGPEIAPADLSYRAIHADHTASDIVGAWELSGSRGEGRAMTGIQIWLRGAAAERFTLQYEARFLDGTQAGPTPAGTACLSPRRSPMSALRLIVRRR